MLLLNKEGKGGKKSGGRSHDTGAGATFSESSKKQGGSNFPNSGFDGPCPVSVFRRAVKKGTRINCHLHRFEEWPVTGCRAKWDSEADLQISCQNLILDRDQSPMEKT